MSEKTLTPTQKLIEAQARIVALETQVAANAETVNQLSLVTQERDKLTADLATANADLAAATSKIAELEKAETDNDAEVERLAGVKAQEVLASTGVAPVAAAPVSAVVTTQELWAAYQQIPNIYEKTRFYRQHEKQMSKSPVFITR